MAAIVGLILSVIAPCPGAPKLVRSVEVAPTPLEAGPRSRRQVAALPTGGPVAIDGRLDEACWSSGLWVSGFLVTDGSGRRADAQTRLKVRFGAESLYMAVRADGPGADSPAESRAPGETGGLPAEDRVVIRVDADLTGTRIFRVGISRDGSVDDAIETLVRRLDPQAPTPAIVRERKEDDTWRSAAEVACSATDRGWTLELRIPHPEPGRTGLIPGSLWGFDVARLRSGPGGEEASSLTGQPPSAFGAEGRLALGIAPIDVTNLDMGGVGVGENTIRFQVSSPRRELGTVDVLVRTADGGPWSIRRALALNRRSPESFEEVYWLSVGPDAAVTAVVQDPDSGETLFLRRASRHLESALRIASSATVVEDRRQPLWVDVELQVGDRSLNRAVLQVELFSPTGRRLGRDRVAEPRPLMRVHLRPPARRRPGQYSVRFAVLDGERELGAASVLIEVVHPPRRPPAEGGEQPAAPRGSPAS